MSRKLVIAVTGLGQSLIEGNGGLGVLMERLKRVAPEVAMAIFPWNKCLEEVVDLVCRWKEANRLGKVFLVGFSYGGTTAVAIAERLHRIGIRVQALFLSDPVWRRFQYIVSLFSMKGRGQLWITSGVANLYSWYQTTTRIRGTTLKRCIPNMTDWHFNRLVENTPHSEMDSVADFHRTVITEVRR